MATTSPETYSIRAWPKGCSLSAGREDILNPIRVTTEEVASDRLLMPSARTEMLPNKAPISAFPPPKSRLQTTPTNPAILPYRVRTSGSFVFG